MGRRAVRQVQGAACGLLLAAVMVPPAQADSRMSCAQAMTLVAGHPGIEANSIIAIVVDEWEAMDRRTVGGGHASITAQMMMTPAAIDALSTQCEINPGQPLGAAAAQVYVQAREQLDGF